MELWNIFVDKSGIVALGFTCVAIMIAALFWLYGKQLSSFGLQKEVKEEDNKGKDEITKEKEKENNGEDISDTEEIQGDAKGGDAEEIEEKVDEIEEKVDEREEKGEEIEEKVDEIEEKVDEDVDILPDEIYFEIFSYLTAEEMEVLSLVSWRWKTIVEDSRLWVSLYDELCDEDEVPIKEKVKTILKPGVNWKTKYFITARYLSADRTEKWKSLLDSLMEGATHGFITDHEMHVIVMSENFKLRVTELDDIFKGVGVKGKYPIPILLRIGKGTYTVLSSANSYFNGLSIVARDLNTSTGLVIVKTGKLILVVFKERCYYFEQIEILQTVFRVSDHLLALGY